VSTVKVSKKGWVVIPRNIRERYGIRPGDRVNVVDYAGRIAIIPALKNPIRQGRGLLKGCPSLTGALLEERRLEQEREERKIRRRPKGAQTT
jgi:AbrB family looped-hinge helix DNA binding protein